MKFLVALCFVAAVAQAVEIDWTKVEPIHIEPAGFSGIPEQSASQSSINSRIVGGDEAPVGAFPWQVAVFSSHDEGTGFCGGSILNEYWILTAAHCLNWPKSIRVIAGAHDISIVEESQQAAWAEYFILHEDWDPTIVKNDVAVIRLLEPLEFNDRVQPVRLPRRSQVDDTYAGQTGIVSGWGRDSGALSISPVLRWTANPILSLDQCNRWYFGAIIDTQVCLSAIGGRSSCNGDSGGPLVLNDSTQVGIVSHGILFGCSSRFPGVYARVASYLDWINEKTGVAIQD